MQYNKSSNIGNDIVWNDKDKYDTEWRIFSWMHAKELEKEMRMKWNLRKTKYYKILPNLE